MMTIMDATITDTVTHPPDTTWISDLREDSPAGHRAQRQLRDVLLRATRHQISRLRHQLPGVGAADLEDLAQQAANDAMIAVLRQLDTFEGRSKFTTWVYKFGILHAGVTVRRQAWRHREVHLPDTHTILDTSASPPGVTEGNDLAAALRHAILHDLTPHQRRITLALLVDEVPIDVLAERLGSSRNALYKTLNDARRRLRTTLTDSGHLEGSAPPNRSAR